MKLLLRILLLVSLSTVARAQSPFVYFPVKTNMTTYTIPSINNRLTAVLGGVTTTNDGFGGHFIFLTNSTATVNSTNVFAPDVGGGRWHRLLIPGAGGTAPFGTAGGDLSGSYPDPTVAKINGVSLGSTIATSGNILVATNSTWVSTTVGGDATLNNAGTLTLANVVSAGTGTKITANAKGLVTTIANATLASSDFANQGTTTTVLHGNASGNPSWAAVSLTADVSGDLPFSNIAQIADNSLLGNFTGGAADIQVLTSVTSANLRQVLSDETGTGVAVFGTAPTFTTSITDPLVIGGTATNSTLVLRSTSGDGSSSASGTAIIFQVGNNGSQEAARFDANGRLGIGKQDPSLPLHIAFSTAGAITRWQATNTALLVVVDDDVATFTGSEDTATLSASRVSSGDTTTLRLAAQAGIEFAVDANSVRVAIDDSGRLGVGFVSSLGAKFSVDGGAHIGGSSDPGDNNLLVDGTGTFTGQLNASSTLVVTGNATFSNVTASRAAAFNSSKVLVSSATTDTELGYLSGVTSAVQTQLNNRVQLPKYGAGNPNDLGTTGDVDGQMFMSTTTGERWWWYATLSTWLP
jgi:hypothetical protein